MSLKFNLPDNLGLIDGLFDGEILQDRFDSSPKVIRVSKGRTTYKNTSIGITNEGNGLVKKDTILINNNHYLNYKGEILITKEPLKIDNKRNIIGYVDENYLPLLDYIVHGKRFKFIK
ncbi:phospho-sugar glycosidase domain-containing protein [Clostridium sp. LP20]|uniref:phospho-sugar glycosidase domain-containing protein n=1 Tax=Clostridium sp. LP20 TaxID=3418665 RepID=UPI003EE7C44A